MFIRNFQDKAPTFDWSHLAVMCRKYKNEVSSSKARLEAKAETQLATQQI